MRDLTTKGQRSGEQQGEVVNSTAIEMNTRLAKSPSVADESTEDDHLVLDLNSGEYFTVGEVGGFIWRQIDGHRSLEEIAGEIVRNFEVAESQASEDLLDFVLKLLDLGLLVAPEV